MSSKFTWGGVYVALIVATNVLFATIGPAPLTFVAAGLTLAARDFVHEVAGRGVSFALVVVGASASALLASPAVAVASFLAFLAAETLDLLVYDVLRHRVGQVGSVAVSGVAGSILDSYIFLTVAFGSLAFFQAQVTGKLLATFGAALLLLIARGVRTCRA